MESIYLPLGILAGLLLLAIKASQKTNKDMKAWEEIMLMRAQQDELQDLEESAMEFAFDVMREKALDLKKRCHELELENKELQNEIAYYRGYLGLSEQRIAV